MAIIGQVSQKKDNLVRDYHIFLKTRIGTKSLAGWTESV